MRHSPLHPLQRILLQSPARRFTTSSGLRRAFKDGDLVLLRKKTDTHDGRLVKLHASKTTDTHRGVIQHADIIGRQPRQLVQTNKGAAYRIFDPTLAEYVRLTPRLVTPIYPSDANLVVSLLDIHVDRPSAGLNTEPPLEILEAGTGHGALTLHLSRAIHAANPPIPRAPSYSGNEDEPEDAVYLGESVSDLQHSYLEAWKQDWRAIIHTLDISPKYSKHAKKIVEGFRHGMYAANVDFHVGDVSDWIAQQKTARRTQQPFLSHVFLDLPGPTRHLANVASALHVNGLLAVFNPSITQIVECVEAIREHNMPFVLEQVIELGATTIREWDVRAVRPRATLHKPSAEPSANKSSDTHAKQAASDAELEAALDKEKEQGGEGETWAMVCRPKAGQQVVGGGFLGLWRRMDKYSQKEKEGDEADEPAG